MNELAALRIVMIGQGILTIGMLFFQFYLLARIDELEERK